MKIFNAIYLYKDHIQLFQNFHHFAFEFGYSYDEYEEYRHLFFFHFIFWQIAINWGTKKIKKEILHIPIEISNTKITPDNFLNYIEYLNPWTIYILSQEALAYYYPYEFKLSIVNTKREKEMMEELNCYSLEDLIILYHIEVGYTDLDTIFNLQNLN